MQDKEYEAKEYQHSQSRNPPIIRSRNEPGGNLRRRDSQETLVSTGATDVESNPSIEYPNPPANTPAVRSLVDADEIRSLLSSKPNGITPPESESDENENQAMDVEGKPHLRSRVRSDIPLLQQLFKQPPKLLRRVSGRRVTPKPKRVGPTGSLSLEQVNTITANTDEVKHTEHFHEHSTWEAIAVEDVTRGLHRLVMAAKDQHKIDPSKSAEQYYGESLAEILNGAELKFDPAYLQ